MGPFRPPHRGRSVNQSGPLPDEHWENAMHHHKPSVRLAGADLARLLETSAQQISRWKADGILPFGEDGMVDALGAIQALRRWDGHGRTPEVVKRLRGQGRDGKAYLLGLADGLAWMGHVAEYHRDQSHRKNPLLGLDSTPMTDEELTRAFTIDPLDTDAMVEAMARDMKQADEDFEKVMREMGYPVGSGSG